MDDIVDYQIGQEKDFTSTDAYQEFDEDKMGGSPYVGGNVAQSYIYGKPLNAVLEAVMVVVILGLVIYVLTQSTAEVGFVWTAGILLVGYFVWNQVGPFVTPFLPSPLRNLLQ